MDTIKEFPVTVYGNLEQYSNTIAKARCRIFYKGANRNGTYITDEFAERLLSTIPYTPVKGIFDAESEDYTDHGTARSQGRIYGIVPEDPHFSWETHLDEDGVAREYACVDVFIYTALYGEANTIVGKSQSMELYDKSIRGEWKFIDGRRYFVFDDASFLGLQALGEDVEPCFEGAAFYTLCDSLKEFVKDLKDCFQHENQGGKAMPAINFKISDNQKANMLWSLLNPNCNEENEWRVDYSILDVYDDYALVRNHCQNTFERVYYSKNDETDSLEITGQEECFIVDINSAEKRALDALRALNGNTFEKVDEVFTERDRLAQENSDFGQKVEELNVSISTLTTEKAEAQANIETLTTEKENIAAEFTQAQETISGLESQLNELTAFKKGIELNEKQAIVNKYSDLLSDETIESFTAKLDDYTALELEKELAYTVVEKNPSIFTKDPQTMYVPKDNSTGTGLEAILSKYEKH